MARKKPSDNLDLPTLGEEGDTCDECGAALATDQRYCLNCGTRRGGSRLEFEQLLFAGPSAGATAGIAPAGPVAGGRAPGIRDWSPLVAVGSIAVLGVMLLLGVLIGRDDNGTQVTAAPTATTPEAAATTPTTAAAPTTPAKTTKTAGAGANKAVAGGSGSTEGIAAATTVGKTGQDLVDASKNSPDVVATEGEPEKLDPNGKPGGGSGSTCIGC